MVVTPVQPSLRSITCGAGRSSKSSGSASRTASVNSRTRAGLSFAIAFSTSTPAISVDGVVQDHNGKRLEGDTTIAGQFRHGRNHAWALGGNLGSERGQGHSQPLTKAIER